MATVRGDSLYNTLMKWMNDFARVREENIEKGEIEVEEVEERKKEKEEEKKIKKMLQIKCYK